MHSEHSSFNNHLNLLPFKTFILLLFKQILVIPSKMWHSSHKWGPGFFFEWTSASHPLLGSADVEPQSQGKCCLAYELLRKYTKNPGINMRNIQEIIARDCKPKYLTITIKDAKRIHTEHGAELHGVQIESTKWTFKVVFFSPLCMIEIWFSAKRV